MKSDTPKGGKSAHPFLRDLEPFFYSRPVTYVDVGAHHGAVFEQLLATTLSVREAHLIEPNPVSFAMLTEVAARYDKPGHVACHNIAISDEPGTLTMRDEGTMTHVAQAPEGTPPPQGVASPYFEVSTTTLDELAQSCGIQHVNVLKVDVEGHERKVLAGAKGLLGSEAIDVIYAEAGMNPGAEQHVYYREIEDLLRPYGYRIFRVYEQTHEWPEDSPALRRVNIAFVSAAFAEKNPYRLSRELYKLRRQYEERSEEASSLKKALEKEQATAAAHRRERDAAKDRLAQTEHRLAEKAVESSESERAISALREERDAYQAYADEVEEKYLRILNSRSWRAMGPVRAAGRAARRALGRSPSGRNRLPKRPRPGGAKLGSSRVAGTADYVAQLLKDADFEQAYSLKRTFETALATEEGFLGHAFLMVTLAKKTSAFGFGAQAADGVLHRYRESRPQLRSALGERGYRRFVADAAVNYARVGRLDDARDLLAAEIAAGVTGLLSTRAEILWTHDPEQAAADLAMLLGEPVAQAQKPGDAVLYRHLALNVLGSTPDAVPVAEPAGEFLLVDAIRALGDDRFGDYRSLVNRFFAEQGLSAPIPDTSDAFSFDALATAEDAGSMTGPLVSVVMTTFNSVATLPYAVRSILEQTHRNLELIVVDDHSTDDTPELLAQIGAADERVRVLRNEANSGTYVSRNRALEAAGGAFLTFHDADDWAHPQRIERHLAAMAADPRLVATRSMWLRTEPDGRLDFRRWHKRLAHPNPASIFMKREALDRVGFFDRVRFSADSEYWFRLQRVFGRAGVRGLPDCLGFGRQHDASLTRSGVGARDAQDYSPIRSAYQYSWLEWHAGSPPGELYLKNGADERRFWAPPEMIADGSANGTLTSLAQCYPSGGDVDRTPTVVFGISLASSKASSDWELTEKLLARSLKSVINQTDGRWRVLICGHERPALSELDDPRVTFVEADIAPPANSGQFRKDKMWKRRLAGSFLRNLGGGYFCPLDADDLVHRDLVKQVIEDDNRHGYRVERGYVEDFANRRLAPVPGVWSAPFDRVCGSSAVLYFERDELPQDGQLDSELYFNLFQSHAYWPIVAEEWGRPLKALPFPGAVYVVNHSQNLSFGLQRAGERTRNIIAAIERDALPEGADVLREEFGQA